MANKQDSSYEEYNVQLTELLELLNLEDRRDLSKVLKGIYATNALNVTDASIIKKVIISVIEDSNRDTGDFNEKSMDSIRVLTQNIRQEKEIRSNLSNEFLAELRNSDVQYNDNLQIVGVNSDLVSKIKMEEKTAGIRMSRDKENAEDYDATINARSKAALEGMQRTGTKDVGYPKSRTDHPDKAIEAFREAEREKAGKNQPATKQQKGFFSKVADFLRGIWNGIIKAIKAMINAIKGLFTGSGKGALGGGNASSVSSNALSDEAVNPALSGPADKVKAESSSSKTPGQGGA